MPRKKKRLADEIVFSKNKREFSDAQNFGKKIKPNILPIFLQPVTDFEFAK